MNFTDKPNIGLTKHEGRRPYPQLTLCENGQRNASLNDAQNSELSV